MKISLYSSILLLLFSCQTENPDQDKQEENSVFPEVKDLSEYPETDFLPTLEHPINQDKNAVYCATLLMAWDEIVRVIDAPVKVEEKYRDLFLMNTTESHKGVLKDDEYEVESEVNGLQIIAKAYFRKSLPFVKKLNAYEDRLTFNGDTLPAFGALYFDEDIKETISIQYYNNDDDFILALQPKDDEHQIFLYLPRKFHPTLKEAATVLKEKILNRADLKDREAWKYSLNDDDEVLVPKFAFNIENEFDSIIGNLFKAGNLEYIVEKVYQRNAFLLDENGAEIESEALVQVSEGSAPPEDLPTPKIMHYDRPFYVFLQRKDAEWPYFGMWVGNRELMDLK